jgi:hypothetical protein
LCDRFFILGLEEEGIFRRSGALPELNALKQKVEDGTQLLLHPSLSFVLSSLRRFVIWMFKYYNAQEIWILVKWRIHISCQVFSKCSYEIFLSL